MEVGEEVEELRKETKKLNQEERKEKFEPIVPLQQENLQQVKPSVVRNVEELMDADLKISPLKISSSENNEERIFFRKDCF